jgi:hypothetical protein
MRKENVRRQYGSSLLRGTVTEVSLTQNYSVKSQEIEVELGKIRKCNFGKYNAAVRKSIRHRMVMLIRSAID